MTRFLIVRHGQSVWNATGRWQGRADPPLSARGREQAAVAATDLPSHDTIAASSLQRAHRTAKILAESSGAAVTIDARLMERDAGGFSGLTRPQIDERYPGYLATGRWPEGWEPQDALVGRILAALDDLAASWPVGQLVVVSHGGVIYALEALLQIEHERVANLEGRWFELVDGSLSAGERLHLLSSAQETAPDQL